MHQMSSITFSIRKLINSSGRYLQPLECCQNDLLALSSFSDPPPLLRQLVMATDSISRGFRSNIRAYNNCLGIGFVKADWECRGLGNSHFNPTMTLHGCKYPFLEGDSSIYWHSNFVSISLYQKRRLNNSGNC